MNSDNTLYAFSIDTPAFSQEYQDEEIPDFRAVIRQTIPISVVQNGENVHFQIGGQSVSDPSFFREAIQASLTTGAKFICHNAAAVHGAALRFMGESQELRDVVWQLTDRHALWDVGLFEQRLIWSVEGRAIDFPCLTELQNRYQTEGLSDLLLAQFNRLVAELPILKNDIAGSLIFADPPPELSYIDPPERILSRRFHFKERLHLFIHLIRGWGQYGPACIGLDVQGAIAAVYLSDRVHQFANCRTRFLRIRDDLFRKKRHERSLRECYPDDPTVAYDDGTPCYTEQAYERIRMLWDQTMRSETDGSEKRHDLDRTFISVHQDRTYPLDSVGRASLNPNHWAETIPPAGPLRDWADIHTSSRLVKLLERNNGQIPYESQPYFKSDVVDFALKQGMDITIPQSGRRHVRIRIRDLDLLCFLHTTHRLSRAVYSRFGAREPINVLGRFVSYRTLHGVELDVQTGQVERGIPEPRTIGTRQIQFLSNYPTVLDPSLQQAGTWNNPLYFRRYGFFESEERHRELFLAAVLRFLVLPPHHAASCDERQFDEVVSRSEQELPDWLRENNLYRRIATDIVRNYIRGHALQTFYRHLSSRFPSIGESANDSRTKIKNAIETITTKSSYQWQFENEFLFVLLPKCGIDPYLIWESPNDPDYVPQFQDVTLFADGQPVPVSWSQSVDDPLLQRAEWRATVRNAIRSSSESRTVHHRVWSEYILRFCKELFEARGILNKQGSELAYDFFFKSNANSSTGKPSRPINEFEAPYLNWPELANDIRSAVAYELIRGGVALVAVADDMFVIEVEGDVNSPAELAGLVKTITEGVLGVKEGYYGHFVEIA